MDRFIQILSVRRLQRNAGHHDLAVRARHKANRDLNRPDRFGAGPVPQVAWLPPVVSMTRQEAAQLFPEGGIWIRSELRYGVRRSAALPALAVAGIARP